MNDPPPAPKDQKQLSDAAGHQRVLVEQNPTVDTSLPAPSALMSQIPGLSFQGAFSLAASGNNTAANKMAPTEGTVQGLLASAQPKVDPMTLLGAAAAVQQQQQMQNAQILRSLMEQKQQITKCEEEIRRRMLLPSTVPILQASLLQNGMGLAGSMGSNFNSLPLPPGTLGQLPTPIDIPLMGDGRALRGGVIEPFPEKLHRLLQETEAAGLSDVISFVLNGRAFIIHKPERFFKEIVPRYFRHKRLSSFKRQLNLYGFELITSGAARGAYAHQMFVKGRPDLCVNMRRSVVSKTHSKNQEGRPDFLLERPVSTISSEAPKAEVKNEDKKTAARADWT